MPETAAQPLVPDVLVPGLRIVFCGTAPSAESYRRRAYYAHPGNRFWPTLAAVGLTPRRLRPAEFGELPRYGLGLTDVCKTAAGQDADLVPGDFDPDSLTERIARYRPGVLAFTSKRAAREGLGRTADYGLQRETLGGARLFVLPSTSGLATRFWDESHWRELARIA